MSVSDRESWERQSTLPQAAQHRQPRFLALPLATLAGQDDLLPRGECADNREEGALAVRDARLHVQAIGPPVDHLQIRQIPFGPRLVLELEADLQPLNGAGRQGLTLAEQPPQREFKISAGEAMQVQLRQQRTNLLGPPHEQREDLARKSVCQIADAWAPHRDSPSQHRKLPGLSVPVPIALGRIHGGYPLPPCMPGAAEERGHLFLQELLELRLNLSSGPLLQRGVTHLA